MAQKRKKKCCKKWVVVVAKSQKLAEKGTVQVTSRVEALRQLVDPVSFSEEALARSDYLVVSGRPGELADGEHTTEDGRTFALSGGKISYLGSLVCELCFEEGRVAPAGVGCVLHRPQRASCGHKYFTSGCDPCRKERSFGACSWADRVARWSTKNKESPWDVAANSHKKFHFDCDECQHSFYSRLDHVNNNSCWCLYCASKCLCSRSGGGCSYCFQKTFAGQAGPEQLSCWGTTNGKKPWEVFAQSHLKFEFDCNRCGHTFCSALSNITAKGRWCPFCAGHSLCSLSGSGCSYCFQKTFAGQAAPEQLSCWGTANGKKPWEVFAQCNGKFEFDCNRCGHTFFSTLNHVIASGTWCPFCSNHRICVKDGCGFCDRPCEIRSVCFDRPRKARLRARRSGRWACRDCLEDASKHDPEETPLQLRARVSMEIYTLAELQRLGAEDNSFLQAEPTAWDCAVLPDLASKPDMIWCFDHEGAVLALAGAQKINLGQVAYALILEILEHGVEEHSLARTIGDREREGNIRGVFERSGVPVGFVYTVMANDTYHVGAKSEDVFFHKDGETKEYSVFPPRLEAWQQRLQAVKQALENCTTTKSKDTVFVQS